MVVDVDVVAIKEEVGGACFALVIVGACFLFLCASAMWAFNYFDTFTHVGIPILNAYNNRSMLNISAEWVNQSVSGMIKENMFRINVGFTFNERWFAKFKVE